MALVQCKECGTLNSSEAEICLSCEYPIQGRARTNWFKWIAIILALMIGLPLAIQAVQSIASQINSQPTKPSVN
jgi:uncharacterized paraquat-inducible protein A